MTAQVVKLIVWPPGLRYLVLKRSALGERGGLVGTIKPYSVWMAPAGPLLLTDGLNVFRFDIEFLMRALINACRSVLPSELTARGEGAGASIGGGGGGLLSANLTGLTSTEAVEIERDFSSGAFEA